ncbi:MAG: DUF6717 family protein [Planctomycetota bacterium]
MNQLFVIEPYRSAGSWVFDDLGAGLVREPFVSGVPEMIDRLVEPIDGAASGFRLLFSAQPMPGEQIVIERQREEYGGHWYRVLGTDHEGWLCPAMFKYFDDPPRRIHVRAEPSRRGRPARSITVTADDLAEFERLLDLGDLDGARDLIAAARSQIEPDNRAANN